jgi:hypothetical protein
MGDMSQVVIPCFQHGAVRILVTAGWFVEQFRGLQFVAAAQFLLEI